MNFCRERRNIHCVSTSPSIGPTDPQARLTSVDAVRGFALFGVLLVNMYNFGAYSSEWTAVGDRIAFFVMHSVFETKSWRLFSFLFGFGFALQMVKLQRQPDGSMWFYLRRLLILFVFGMGHALFYDGDILMEYSMLGLVLIAFYKVPDRTLLLLAFLLLAAFPLGNLYVSATVDEPFAEDEQSQTLAERREGHEYLGSVADVVKANAHVIPPRVWSNLHGPEASLAVFAMFLLGLYAGRNRILHDASRHLPLIRTMFGWGIGIGVIFAIAEWLLGQTLGYAVFRENTASLEIQLVGDFLFAYGSTMLALGYGAGIVLLTQKEICMGALRVLQSMGKMALTVYLSGTLLFTLLFYGYGFGLIFLLGPAKTSLFAVLFFCLQAAFCVWWLKRFRYGPMEWIWRSLTYRKVFPIRVAEAQPVQR